MSFQTTCGASYTIGISIYGSCKSRGSDISEQIPVRSGTRQAGLTSPLIFNIYYKELIDELQCCPHGIHIGEKYYNVFVYAYNILLCSTSVSGLQELINIATTYVNKFNPVKTTCTIMGNNPFTSTPSWTTDKTELKLYVSYIRQSNKWYHCDDKHITETNLLTLSNNVYLMFYAKEVDLGT